MVLRYKLPCPRCFGDTGFSIVMEEVGDGVFQCPRNREHRFRKGEHGFWENVYTL